MSQYNILNFLALPGGLGPAAVQPALGIMGVWSDEWLADCAGGLGGGAYDFPVLQKIRDVCCR